MDRRKVLENLIAQGQEFRDSLQDGVFPASTRQSFAAWKTACFSTIENDSVFRAYEKQIQHGFRDEYHRVSLMDGHSCEPDILEEVSTNAIGALQGMLQAIKALDSSAPVEDELCGLLEALNRFDYATGLHGKLESESQVQKELRVLLVARYDSIESEEYLERFGLKHFKPDFGVPDLGTLIEAKYVGKKTSVKTIQEQMMSDVPGYLVKSTKYSRVIFFVYDPFGKALDPRFIMDMKAIEGVFDVVVTRGAM